MRWHKGRGLGSVTRVMAEPHIIVLGNEKGGSGKSTSAMHIAVALLRDGHRVGVIDLDSRQRTFSRYCENRAAFAAAKSVKLPHPEVRVVARSMLRDLGQAEAEERSRFHQALDELKEQCQYVVIDSPGSDNFLARLGHAMADTLVTPLNDSFIDLDLLARIDPDTYEVKDPSLYSQMVWEQKLVRAKSRLPATDWVVLRNRLSHLDAKNKQRVRHVLDRLGPRIGFRQAPGLSERVIYREMFLSGLTLLDFREKSIGAELTMSHVAARQELRALLEALKLPVLAVSAIA